MKTYAEWNSLGYRIHRGSKAKAFVEGTKEPLFDNTQVYLPETLDPNARYVYRGITGEWDDMPH